MEDIAIFVGLPVVIAVVSYFTYSYFHSGLTAAVEVTEKESAPLLGKSTTLFYKHEIGSYSSHKTCLKELIRLLPQGASTIRVLYDDASKTQARKLQAAVGCIFGEETEDYYTQNFVVQLKRFGFERLVVRPTGKVLSCVVPHNQSWFSDSNMSNRVIPALRKVFDKLESKPDVMVVVEIVDTSSNTAHAFVPLENVEEFVDAQHLSVDELDAKLARQKFDSDQESSESEPDFSGDEKEGEDSEIDSEEGEEDTDIEADGHV